MLVIFVLFIIFGNIFHGTDISGGDAVLIPQTSIGGNATEKRYNMEINNSPSVQAVDFSYLIPFAHGVQLTLNKIPINLTAFSVDQSNERQLEELLRGRNVSELLYVAAKIAGINAKIAEKMNRTIKTLELEEIFDPSYDIMLTADYVDELERDVNEDHTGTHPNQNSTTRQGRSRRKADANLFTRWRTPIPYRITSDFDAVPDYVDAIEAALRYWEDETCVVFNKVNEYQGNHIIFKKLSGCNSLRGMIPSYTNGQDISIGTGCGTVGIVTHEVGHALGFSHEHQRPDRDRYIKINNENIKDALLYAFFKTKWHDILTEGVPYDYSSLMHYNIYAFSKNGNKTISVLEEDMEKNVGNRNSLSYYDTKLVNYMYCQGECAGGLVWSACKHDGYRNPKNCSICRCPDGWGGQYCTEVQQGHNANCSTPELTASSVWQTLKSPTDETGHHPMPSACTWRITTPSNTTRIRIRFTEFSFHCRMTCYDYIEVRYRHLERVGPRYCCSNQAVETVSQGTELLLLFRVTTQSRFTLQYRVEDCGGCSVPATNHSDVPCVNAYSYTCYQNYSKCSTNWRGTTCDNGTRIDTCYKEVKSCCENFELRGHICLRAWSPWSNCNKTCDNGTRTRTGYCIDPPCLDGSETTGWGYCNTFFCVGQWAAWGDWSDCSNSTCSQDRSRTCLKDPCGGSAVDQRRCNGYLCLLPPNSADCVVSAWWLVGLALILNQVQSMLTMRWEAS